jgi:hypothetical protein
MVNLNEASFSLFGEEPHEAWEDSPPHTQFDVGMSANDTRSSGVAIPPRGPTQGCGNKNQAYQFLSLRR